MALGAHDGGRMTKPPGAGAVGFPTVFATELREHVVPRRTQIGGVVPVLQGDEAPEDPHRWNLVGVALSGGGMRSAAFNLGVLQALGRRGVLQRCDYLSTVSGGGYIGASFTSLLGGGGYGVAPGTFPFCSTGAQEC